LSDSTQSLSNIIILSAPSGAGKTSICNAIVCGSRNIAYSVSYTTRLPRRGEKNGRDYFFVSENKFRRMVKENKFAEWSEVHGNYYGTLKAFLDKMLKRGKNVLLEIDVCGGISIKKIYPGACMIFIMTPDIKTLENRLLLRNKDRKEIIKMRVENAKKELKSIQKYEYLVINKKLSVAVKAVKTIIDSLKYKIQKDKIYFNQRR